MQVRVGCEFEYESDGPVPMLMLVRARSDAAHRILYESRFLQPDLSIREYRDAFGNDCWRFRLPGGAVTIRYDAVAYIDGLPDPISPAARVLSIDEVPNEALVFTLPSRYVPSDLLSNAAWELFGSTPPTWARVQAICDWIHSNITYQTGSSDPTTTAHDVFQSRVGVCRDFALLAVAFCRALNVPARYAFGYFPDIAVEPPDVPMDFHAWFEAYLEDRWYSFDARHNTPRIGRVLVGVGRDAVDVALSTAYGNARLNRMTVWSDETDPARTLIEDDADTLEVNTSGLGSGESSTSRALADPP